MNEIKEADIPNILASKPSGKSTPQTINVMVVPPPSNMDQNAAFGFGFFKNNPPMTGMNNPETMNA